MAEQTRGAAVFLPRSEFDAFLFTEIGEDNHMPLTVLSALARVDVDPWAEAEQLARLTSAAAAERLASLIDETPNGPRQTTDPAFTAVGLVALLPRRAVAAIVTRALPAAVTGRKSDVQAIVLSCALLALLLGVGWLMAGRQAAERAAAPPASAAVQPPSAGK